MIYADGPDADLVHGVIEQKRLYDIIKEAKGLWFSHAGFYSNSSIRNRRSALSVDSSR